jgi:hypothetical protein
MNVNEHQLKYDARFYAGGHLSGHDSERMRQTAYTSRITGMISGRREVCLVR